MNELTICEKIPRLKLSVINVIHLCKVELLHTIASFGITQTKFPMIAFGEMNCTPKLGMWIRWHVIPRRNRIWMQCLLNSKMESLNIIGMIRWIALNKLKAMFTFYLINYNLTMTFNSTPESIIVAQMDKSNSLKC